MTQSEKRCWTMLVNNIKFNFLPSCHISISFHRCAAPTASILGGPDFYVQKGSTINLTCTIRLGPDESPAFIFWYHEDEVMSLWITEVLDVQTHSCNFYLSGTWEELTINSRARDLREKFKVDRVSWQLCRAHYNEAKAAQYFSMIFN